MGLPSGEHAHARHGHEPRRRHDRRAAAPLDRARHRLIAALAALLPGLGAGAAQDAPPAAPPDTIRVAYWGSDLSREGPGLLLRDLDRGAPDLDAAADLAARARPDVLVLGGFDRDEGGLALAAFARMLSERGHEMPHRASPPTNAGRPTGRDLDRDGRIGARDAHGWGRFEGQGAIAILSRLPLGPAGSFTELAWDALPGAPGPDLTEGVRLSSTSHAVYSAGPLTLAVWAATPPVFDGPEDRNGIRGGDEARLWTLWLDGALGRPAPEGPLVIAGRANIDPMDGDGAHAEIRALLAHPRLRDAGPRAPAPPDPPHGGDPGLDTARFGGAAGALRTDYLLPSAGIEVAGGGLLWPEPPATSRHALLWLDLSLPAR